MGDSVKYLPKVKIKNIHCALPIHCTCHFVVKSHFLHKFMVTTPGCLLTAICLEMVSRTICSFTFAGTE